MLANPKGNCMDIKSKEHLRNKHRFSYTSGIIQICKISPEISPNQSSLNVVETNITKMLVKLRTSTTEIDKNEIYSRQVETKLAKVQDPVKTG